MADNKEVKHVDYSKLKHKSIEDVLKHIAETHYAEIGDSLTDLDNFKDKKYQESLQADIMIPSFDAFYKTVDNALNKEFKGDGNSSLNKKDKELKKILAIGLLEYLKKASPSLHKTLTTKNSKIIEGKLDEAYEDIAHHVDYDILGADPGKGLYSNLVKGIMKNKKATVNTLKNILETYRSDTHDAVRNHLMTKKMNVTMGKYHAPVVASHILDKVVNAKESGYKVLSEDIDDFLRHGINESLRVYDGVKTGQWTDHEGKAASSAFYRVTTSQEYEKKKKKGELVELKPADKPYDKVYDKVA